MNRTIFYLTSFNRPCCVICFAMYVQQVTKDFLGEGWRGAVPGGHDLSLAVVAVTQELRRLSPKDKVQWAVE